MALNSFCFYLHSAAWQYELSVHSIPSFRKRVYKGDRRGLKNSTLVCTDGVVVYKLRAFSGENEGALDLCDMRRASTFLCHQRRECSCHIPRFTS